MTDTTLSAPIDTQSLQIGDTAPNFQARTTMGMVKLSDFRGKWLILFSHPADFTPVCTSEFVAFSKAADRFAALDCNLLAVSVDSLFSHFGWISAIRDTFDVNLSFPIVEDPSMVIGRAYGMIKSTATDASAMRSTFFIDPDGIIRSINIYPATIGRSVDEMLRIIAALQRVDAHNIVAPADWQPGDDILLPPHLDQASILAPDDSGPWFYRTAPDKGPVHGKSGR